MAKAAKTTFQETIVRDVQGVHLTLSMAEAKALYMVLQYVGGDPEDTARCYTDSITFALETAGVTCHSNGGDGSFYFTEESRAAVEE